MEYNLFKTEYADYLISQDGKIFNKKDGKPLQTIIKEGYNKVRYSIGTNENRITKLFRVDYLVASTYLSNPSGYRYINHKDGNKRNNSAENLEWCTRSENIQHAYDNGLNHGMKGTSNGRCKLKETDVLYIREKYIPFDKDFGAKALAKRFGVAPQTISAVITKQNWGEL